MLMSLIKQASLSRAGLSWLVAGIGRSDSQKKSREGKKKEWRRGYGALGGKQCLKSKARIGGGGEEKELEREKDSGECVNITKRIVMENRKSIGR